MYPRYSHPFSRILSVGANLFFGGRRSFREDGRACVERLIPPLRVLGKENIPQTAPGLITFNHYHRPSFNAWWMALAIAANVPVDIHFVMTGELTFSGRWYASLGMAGSRWLLRRFSKIYGFTAMPPMPPRLQDAKKRARAVRKVLAYAKEHPQAILGLAPEGGDQPGGLVKMPPPGAGRFILLLAGQRCPIQPVGCFEENGEFCLRFGKPYWLQVPSGLSRDEKDRQLAHIVMSAIVTQLPAYLRGEFS
jgi:hypothetical protein